MATNGRGASGDGGSINGVAAVGRPRPTLYPISVLFVDGHELDVVIACSDPLPSKIRFAFRSRSKTVEMLARVTASLCTDGETGAALKCISAYTKAGKEALEQFLSDRLGCAPLIPANFEVTERGAYYLFEPDAATRRPSSTVQRRPRPAKEPPKEPEKNRKERRWRRRVRLSLTARLELPSGMTPVIVSEASERGIRIDTPPDLGRLPDKGARVRLHVSVPHGPLSLRLVLGCRVIWTVAGASDEPSSIGLELSEVGAAASSQWSRFVASSAEHHEIVPAFERGKPLPV